MFIMHIFKFFTSCISCSLPQFCYLFKIHQEAYSGPCQISAMECSCKNNDFLSWIISQKRSIIDVCQGHKYALYKQPWIAIKTWRNGYFAVFFSDSFYHLFHSKSSNHLLPWQSNAVQTNFSFDSKAVKV